MEDLNGEVRCAGEPTVSREERRAEVSCEGDIDRVMDDDVLAEGPRFGDERLAAADHHGESEETLDRRGGTSLVDDVAEQHSPNGTSYLDVEVIGHPPLSIPRCQREQAPAER